jgi:hypothetical protein
MTAEQLKEYLENVTKFEKDGRWGLRVMDDIIVKPIYTYISNFKGDYAVGGMMTLPRLSNIPYKRRCMPIPQTA